MEHKCETCGAYKACKTFGSDGICHLVPSKPKWVKKQQTCKYWREEKEKKRWFIEKNTTRATL